MTAVLVMCGVWMWKSVALQLSHALDAKRAGNNERSEDVMRAIRHLRAMREVAIVKSQETLRGVDKQRLVDDAACFMEAIQRLQGVDAGVRRKAAA